MLDLPRELLQEAGETPPRVAVLGIGNAGVALTDRLMLAGYSESLDLIAVNTDAVSLGSSVVEKKILIGSKSARGLGTGGDPEIGAEAAEEAEAEIAEALADARIVVIAAGLGGGAGSGGAPVVAELAKRNGKLTVVLATLPFSFEGRRRTQQAELAKKELSAHADAMLIFENDRMAELTEPLAGVHETFAASDQVLADAVGFLARVVLSKGPIRVTVSDLFAVFGRGAESCAFGFAQAAGPNRANEAVERALKCPLMGRGKPLAEAPSTLVHIAGPENLTLAEVRAVMEALARHSEEQLHLGISIDPDIGDLISVTVLAPIGAPSTFRTPRPASTGRKSPSVPVPQADLSAPDLEPALAPSTASELFDTEPYKVEKKSSARKAPKPEQKTLSLDPVARGRFEKSEPTIVGGEDLDVPTFLRRKIKLL